MSDAVIETEERKIVVQRFTLADIPRWSEWMLRKMQHAFDRKGTRITAQSFPGLITQYMNSNEHCFLRTDYAVGLCEIRREAFEERPKARVIFLWLGLEEASMEMLRLARHLELWAREHGCDELIFSKHVDISFGQWKSSTNSIDRPSLVRDLTKPIGARGFL